MTRLQVKLEDKNTLAYISKELNFGKFFIISKQIEIQNGRKLDKLHEDVFEAFICALYLSNNYNTCLLFITNLLETLIDYSDKLYCDNNYKDFLLRVFHKKKWSFGPKYKTIAIEGTIYKKKYIIGVENIDNGYLGYGIGTSKKEGEQKAAKMALILLGYLNKDQYSDNDLYYHKFINLENTDNQLINEKIKSDILTSEEIINNNENNILITEINVINILNKNNIKISKINNFEYIIHAFIHKSYYKKNIQSDILFKDISISLHDKCYEKLKYIGDKVLKLAISTYLFFRYPNSDEGFMTRLEIKLEDKNNFIIMSKELELQKYFIISSHIESLRDSDKLHEEIFESFIGALFLTCGFEVSLLLITNLMETLIDYSEKIYCDNNYKDYLLRIYHQKKWNDPKYVLISSNGPSHKIKYIMAIEHHITNNLYFEDKYIGYGTGFSKKMAEQKAAKMTLIKLGYLNNDQYTNEDLYYYYFYKEKLEKYLNNTQLVFTLVNNNDDKYIVEFKYNNIISYGISDSLNDAEIKASKMALILLNVIKEYSSDDIFYYQPHQIEFSEKSI